MASLSGSPYASAAPPAATVSHEPAPQGQPASGSSQIAKELCVRPPNRAAPTDKAAPKNARTFLLAAKKAYDKGVKLAQQQKHEEALKLFEESLKELPSYLLALNKLGEQHLALKHPAEAQAAFQKALEINPKFVLPHINMGILFTAQKQFDEAIREFEACNQIDDSYPMSHLNLGLALMSLPQPDFDRAEKELTRCLQLGGRNFVDVHKYLFNLHVRQNAMDKAAQQLEAYLSEAPEAPDAEDVRQQLQRVKKYIAQQASAVKK